MGNRGGICDIDGLMEDFPAGVFLNLRSGLFEFGCVASANGYVGAFAGEFFGNSTAKSFAGGGDDGYAALQSQIQICTSFKLSMLSRNARRVKLLELLEAATVRKTRRDIFGIGILVQVADRQDFQIRTALD